MTNLFKNGLYGPTAFSASCEGHNAKGAHVVAPPHDGEVCADIACRSDWQDVCISFLSAELHIHGAFLLPSTCTWPALQESYGVLSLLNAVCLHDAFVHTAVQAVLLHGML